MKDIYPNAKTARMLLNDNPTPPIENLARRGQSPQAGSEAVSAGFTGSIAKVGDAREFLIDVMENEFADKTFANYINTKLAGDYACEIAVLLKCLYNKIEQ